LAEDQQCSHARSEDWRHEFAFSPKPRLKTGRLIL
jgi:hypothetical protein